MGPKSKATIPDGALQRLQVLQTGRQGFQPRQGLAAFQQAAHGGVVTTGMLHSQHRPSLGSQLTGQPFHLGRRAPQTMAEQQPSLGWSPTSGPPQIKCQGGFAVLHRQAALLMPHRAAR